MRRPRIALTAALAWVGVVLGHLAAYILTYPNQGIRHVHLEITGHDWLGVATASLLAAVPVILLMAAVRSVRSEAPWTGPGLALRLLMVQIPAFASLEVLERGWSVQEALFDPAVFVGLMLQPLLAVVAAWALDLLHRAVRAIVVRLQAPRRIARRTFPRPAPEIPPFRARQLFPTGRRAPPHPSFV